MTIRIYSDIIKNTIQIGDAKKMVLKFIEHNGSLKFKCNKCGREISEVGFFRITDYIMPYGSKFDYDTLNLTICVDCLDEFVSSCKINPITEYSVSEEQGGRLK